jgi:hypothetical protein
MAQAFYQAGANAAPDIWEHLLVAETGWVLVKTWRPDRIRAFAAERKEAWELALESFTVDSYTAATLAGQTIHQQGIRFYILNACARRKERKIPTAAAIDAEIQWTLNWAWNQTGWNFQRRQVRLLVNVLDVTDAEWTANTRTLTKVGAFTDYVRIAGDRIIILGPLAQMGESLVATRASDNAITLSGDIGAADGQDDISARIISVSVRGLAAGETMDRVASSRLYIDSVNAVGVDWAPAETMAMAKARFRATSGPVRFVRSEVRTGMTVWHFAPDPAQPFAMRGEVFIAPPAAPANATDSAPFDAFPAAMRPHLRDMALGRVLTRLGIEGGEKVWQRAVDDVHHLFAAYDDRGVIDDNPTVRDVYGDAAVLGYRIGGGM